MAHDQGRGRSALATYRALVPMALCVVLLASACARDPGSVVVGDPNAPPANYRAEILAYLKSFLNDPTAIREAFITEPTLTIVSTSTMSGITQRYLVCLRFNAKNSIGRYEGSRDRVVAFLSGRLDTMAPARGEQCKDVSWAPFPELEQLKR